ncbi:uncharacterized protein IL334_003522 [Kwoniella shivajii]|uniref:Uncharacterized protein n=1 Tax=Kwoniella shivajii TaxID=564305 RepID=A0ABZ1CXT3_9TREE|nr:hypothetical protein IL334_003522 [Kwoniella shivajii]
MSDSSFKNRLSEDDFSDIVKISPPNSSATLSSYGTVDESSIKSEPVSSDHSSSLSGSGSGSGTRSNSNRSSSGSSVSTDQSNSKVPIYSSKPIPIDSRKTPTETIKKEVKPDGEILKDVSGVVEDTVRKVRQQSDKLQVAAQPYADKTRCFAETRPVLFTFIAIWAGFSMIPLLVFLGFALATTVFIVSTAVFFSGLVIIGTVLTGVAAFIGTLLFGAAILTPILFITTLLALGTLTTLLGLFLVHRLYLHVSISSSEEGWTTSALSVGIKSWAEETFQRVQSSLPVFQKTKIIEIGYDTGSGKGLKWDLVENVNTRGDVNPIINEKVDKPEVEDAYNSSDLSSSGSTSTAAPYLNEKGLRGGNREDIPRVDDWSEKPNFR